MRDSSLAACTQAVIAARCDHLRLAFDYAAEATLIDLQDLEHNVADGLHIASLAGAWIAFVHGFGGLQDHGDSLAFTPKLPDGLTRYSFSIVHRDRCLHVDVTASRAEYVLKSPATLSIVHYGEELTVSDAAPVVRPIPPIAPRDPPRQPRGRAPRRRSPR